MSWHVHGYFQQLSPALQLLLHDRPLSYPLSVLEMSHDAVWLYTLLHTLQPAPVSAQAWPRVLWIDSARLASLRLSSGVQRMNRGCLDPATRRRAYMGYRYAISRF